MPGFKSPDHNQRRTNADEAKKALLEKFRAAPGPGDPAYEQRQAERAAVQAARLARETEREQARKADEARRAEEARLEAERRAQAEREAAELAARTAAEEADREAALKAEQKAARDARYAARKAAKKQRRKG